MQGMTIVINDIRDYVRKYGKQVLMSVLAAFICYGFLVFSGNIRIDTEELINEPGSKLGWLKIGRFGLALLKEVLGLSTHSVVKSGILFFVFFLLGANLLCFAMWRFSRKRDYPYGIFLLLYVTSNIWSYQIYFSVQQAEVACAMFLLLVAAICSVQACFSTRGMQSVWRTLTACVLLVLGIGAYQALATYYIALCIIFFLVWLDAAVLSEHEGGADKVCHRRILAGIGGLLTIFGVSYVIYGRIAKAWFMSNAGYMADQMGWGKYPVSACIRNILRAVRDVLIARGSRNFSFYTAGIVLVAILLITEWNRRRKKGTKPDAGFVWKVLAFSGLMMTPFLMTIYMGEILVTRSQFALPVAAAFLGMYAVSGLQDFFEKWVWMKRVAVVLVLAAATLQIGYNLQLTHTDNVRYAQDVQKSEQLVTVLEKAGDTEIWDRPIVFVGFWMPELDAWCSRTEMYGWSFYEWDYSPANQTGATHRIAGFLRASQKLPVREEATDEMRREAVNLSKKQPVFPEDGCVLQTDEFTVVKLSEMTE